MRRLRHGALLLLAAVTAAQDSPPDPGREWQDLRDRLTSGDTELAGSRGAPIDLANQVRMIRSFLERWRSHPRQGTPDLIDARLRLAALLSSARDWSGAEAAFQEVLAVAPDDALDARGRARYGLAQSRILQGDVAGGRALLTRLRDELVGTRWSDHAAVALHSLSRDPKTRCRVGEPAPEFGPRVDRSGHVQSRKALFGEPAVLLFVSAADPEALASTWRWIRASRRAGLPLERVLVFLLDTDPGDRWTLAVRDDAALVVTPTDEAGNPVRDDTTALSTTTFAAPRGFLDEAFLGYRIDAIPSCVLIGPDGTLLARDAPPDRLEEALRKLLR